MAGNEGMFVGSHLAGAEVAALLGIGATTTGLALEDGPILTADGRGGALIVEGADRKKDRGGGGMAIGAPIMTLRICGRSGAISLLAMPLSSCCWRLLLLLLLLLLLSECSMVNQKCL